MTCIKDSDLTRFLESLPAGESFAIYIDNAGVVDWDLLASIVRWKKLLAKSPSKSLLVFLDHTSVAVEKSVQRLVLNTPISVVRLQEGVTMNCDRYLW